MTTDTIISLISEGVVIAGGCFGGYIKLVQQINANHTSIIERVTRVETLFESMGARAIKSLHSPDNHLKVDGFVDKYHNGHYDMSQADWIEFKMLLETIHDDKTKTDLERSSANLGIMLAEHKLMRYRI